MSIFRPSMPIRKNGAPTVNTIITEKIVNTNRLIILNIRITILVHSISRWKKDRTH